MFLISLMVRVLSVIGTLLHYNVIYKVIRNFAHKFKNKLLDIIT